MNKYQFPLNTAKHDDSVREIKFYGATIEEVLEKYHKQTTTESYCFVRMQFRS